MSSSLEIAYIGLASPQPDAVHRFLGEVVGLMPGAPLPDGARSWRNDRKAHRVWVEPGARADACCIGFEVADEAAWRHALERLERAGYPAAVGALPELAARRVRALARVRAPWGVDVEIVHGLADADTPFESPGYPDGFVTAGQGFGHAVFAVGDEAAYQAACRFAIDGLGLRLSDWLRMPLGAGGEMHVSFLHCNARHHSLALARLPGPPPAQRLHHINFEVASVGDVGRAQERALAARTPLANTLGQHDNDAMVSFYAVSPDGWLAEIGATGRTIGADWTDVREYDRISRWGHQPPAVLIDLLTPA